MATAETNEKSLVISVLSDSFQNTSTNSFIESQIDKYLASLSVKHVLIGAFGRAVDVVIASKLNSLSIPTICYSVSQNEKHEWMIRTKVQKLVQVKYRVKPIIETYEKMINKSEAVLAFWTGSTISNDVQMALEYAKANEKHIITKTIPKG